MKSDIIRLKVMLDPVRRRIMLGTDIRGIIAEEEEVQRRKDALKSLLSMRSKQLRESLEQRIKRARICGDWIQLSEEECATLHKREKLHLKYQIGRASCRERV